MKAIIVKVDSKKHKKLQLKLLKEDRTIADWLRSKLDEELCIAPPVEEK